MLLHVLNFTLLSTSYLNSDTTLESAKIVALNAETYRNVCSKLKPDLPGEGWKTMAVKMGYNFDEVNSFSRNDSPADAVLQHWRRANGNNLSKLIEILKEMGRYDVVEIIEQAEWV